jgi:hypothetical protein
MLYLLSVSNYRNGGSGFSLFLKYLYVIFSFYKRTELIGYYPVPVNATKSDESPRTRNLKIYVVDFGLK